MRVGTYIIRTVDIMADDMLCSCRLSIVYRLLLGILCDFKWTRKRCWHTFCTCVRTATRVAALTVVERHQVAVVPSLQT